MYWTRCSRSFSRCRAPRGSGAPRKVISPVQLLCSPAMQRASVVFPEPDSPTTATQDSGGTSSRMPASTGVWPYRAETSRTDKIAEDPSGSGPGAGAGRVGLPGADLADAQASHGAMVDEDRLRYLRPAVIDREAATVRERAARAAAAGPGLLAVDAGQPLGVVGRGDRPDQRRACTGCKGSANNRSVGPSSMMRPAYMTATSDASPLTTARSWLT